MITEIIFTTILSSSKMCAFQGLGIIAHVGRVDVALLDVAHDAGKRALILGKA